MRSYYYEVEIYYIDTETFGQTVGFVRAYDIEHAVQEAFNSLSSAIGLNGTNYRIESIKVY